MTVRAIPEGYRTVTPYLICAGAATAIDYYRQAFGAKERSRHEMPGGVIGHAEIEIGDSILMLADEFPQMNVKGPLAIGGTPVGLCIYVNNVDEVFNRAINAGGKVERPLANQFYGDRTGTLIDPFGHKWTIATHIEDVTLEEMQKRMEAVKPA